MEQAQQATVGVLSLQILQIVLYILGELGKQFLRRIRKSKCLNAEAVFEPSASSIDVGRGVQDDVGRVDKQRDSAQQRNNAQQRDIEQSDDKSMS